MSGRQFISRNPINNTVIKSFNFQSNKDVEKSVQVSYDAFKSYRFMTQQDKAKKFIRLADLIEAHAQKYAKLITTEMGKPITQAMGEVKKSAAYCRFFAENAEKFLKPQRVKTEASESYVKLDPLGPVYVITPFNFPFWLCFKPSIPQLLVGNTIIHRTSDSTPLIGKALEELFNEAGFDQVFQDVLTTHEQTELIVKNPVVAGVSFTGSTNSGQIISSIAGKYLKRNVMELGGLDPFMVMREAKVEKAVDFAVKARVANCGQVCIAAKRFIIHKNHYEKFRDLLVQKLQNVVIGDPLDEKTQMGPLARWDFIQALDKQIQESVDCGGKVIYGGKAISQRPEEGNFYQPTVIECTRNNPIVREESFGPIFPLLVADNDAEIIEIANDTKYGLGAMIVTENTKDIKNIINQIDAGMVFVNEVVKTDQRIPSGGIKSSGYGRECSEWALYNFANIKTVWIQ